MFVHSIHKLTQDSDDDSKVGTDLYRVFHTDKADHADDFSVSYVKSLPGGLKWADLSKHAAPLETKNLDLVAMEDAGSYEDLVLEDEWPNS